MARRVLTILALLPLLLPPGLCVCHSPRVECAGRAAALGGRAALAHFCLHHDGDDDHDAPNPADDHHGHAPGCPALKGLDTWLARPQSAVQVTAPSLVVPLPALHPLTPASSAPACVAELGCLGNSPPLHLTLCTLLC